MISSFERCCNALSIEHKQQSTSGLPHDAPAVQKLLAWLAARGADQKWLVVLDNVDTLDHLSHVIPQNARAGSVIITSQDGKAAKLLYRAKHTKVDSMGVDEAKALLAQCMDINLSQAHEKIVSLLEQLSKYLDGIALALNLAGARIRDGMENKLGLDDTDVEAVATAALEQYFIDFEEHKSSVLADAEQSSVSSYKKTIWTVWETVLASLERSAQSDAQASAYPLQLLKLAAILGPTVIHREVFRAASQSFAEVCSGLNVDAPMWLQRLLQVTKTGTWDSFAYKASLERLMRFNLVHHATHDVLNPGDVVTLRPLLISWPGFTMHGLVRWRAAAQAADGECDTARTILLAACCRECNDSVEDVESIDFRRAMHDYLRSQGRDWRTDAFSPRRLVDFYTAFGSTSFITRDFAGAERFLTNAYRLGSDLSGGLKAYATHAAGELLKLYLMGALRHKDPARKKEYRTKADEVLRATVEQKKREEGERGEGGRGVQKALQTRDIELPQLLPWLEELALNCLETETQDAQRQVILDESKKKYDEHSPVISGILRSLELTKQDFGQYHRTVRKQQSSLARFYGYFRKLELEERILDYLLANEQQCLGSRHLSTMQSMQRLALCRMHQERPNAAAQMMETLCQISREAPGNDDPRTCLRESHLQEIENGRSTTPLTENERRARVDHNNFVFWEETLKCVILLQSWQGDSA